MPLIPFKDMLSSAGKGDYAVGYFEAWNQDSLEAPSDCRVEAETEAQLRAAHRDEAGSLRKRGCTQLEGRLPKLARSPAGGSRRAHVHTPAGRRSNRRCSSETGVARLRHGPMGRVGWSAGVPCRTVILSDAGLG